ncbi:MAG: hypothetical protein RLZZ621_421 [Gemmatimonadota bacterium]|jgi:SAM-dependent methyltransferase
MERDAFALMAEAEANHWWFRGRRAFIAATLKRIGVPRDAMILDAGCGSGGNLPLLAQFGHVHGFEFDRNAMECARARGIGTIASGWLPDGVPDFADVSQFDVIGLFDVLEHLSKPVESLRVLATRLAPGGAIVITVPALPVLWGPHDVTHQHVRRYTRRMFRAHIEEAGLRVEYLTGINLLLLPLAVLQRLRERMLGYRPADLIPSPFLNQLLFRILRCELRWLPRRTLPLGLSLLAIVRRETA